MIAFRPERISRDTDDAIAPKHVYSHREPAARYYLQNRANDVADDALTLSVIARTIERLDPRCASPNEYREGRNVTIGTVLWRRTVVLFYRRDAFAVLSCLLLIRFECASVVASTQMQAAAGDSLREHALVTSARPTIDTTRARSATTALYTIKDVGLPRETTYPSSSPVGFNNSGQIFGVALRSAKSNRASYDADTDCLVWTGSRFIDLEPSLAVQQCTPFSIGDADPKSGAYDVVGGFTDIHHAGRGYTDAFYATVAASGSYKTEPYYDHSPAALYGVNAAGMATGSSFDHYIDAYPIFVTAEPAALTYLQPSCATTSTGCLEPIELLKTQTNGEPLGPCAFGGCEINARGTVVGFDPVTSDYAVSTIGAPSSLVELPLPIAPGNFGYVVALNDANQLVYFTIGRTSASFVYNLNAGTTTPIPPVAGTSCAHYYPISINNLGEVLGFSSFCKQGSFYYTWSPVTGTQDLNLELPANAYTIKPLGINDNGQILVSLGTSGGATHWGTLDPVAAAAKTSHPRAKELHHAR